MKTIEPKNKWHVNEVAIYGTHCDIVKEKVRQIQSWCNYRRLAYIDASHREEPSVELEQLTTHSDYFEIQTQQVMDETLLLEFDGAVVNGNHHRASKQVVYLNVEKESSLRKRFSELTQVEAIVLPTSLTEVPAFAWEGVSKNTRIIIEGSEEEFQFWRNQFPTPELKALILVGGMSSRMGEEKGLIHYQEKAQVEVLSNLFASLGIESYLSCRPEQVSLYESFNIPFVFDQVQGGPLGGILSALRSFPQTAFLVVACDLPNLNAATLKDLLARRQPKSYATCFESPMDGGPEPLCSIYEPKSASALAQVWANGKNCPRKMLFNRNVTIVPISNKEYLANANTPEDRAQFYQKA